MKVLHLSAVVVANQVLKGHVLKKVRVWAFLLVKLGISIAFNEVECGNATAPFPTIETTLLWDYSSTDSVNGWVSEASNNPRDNV